MRKQKAMPQDGADEARNGETVPVPQGEAHSGDDPAARQGKPGSRRGRKKPPESPVPDLPFEEIPPSAAGSADDDGAAKVSRSKRRRQRRNEAKRLARAEASNGEAPAQGGEAGEPAPQGEARPVQRQQERKGRGMDGQRQQKNPKPDGARSQGEGQRRHGQGKPSQGRAQGQGGQGQYGQSPAGARAEGRRKKGGQGERPRDLDRPRREGNWQRRGRSDDRREDRRDGGYQYRDRKPASDGQGPVLPPPDVIASLEGGDYQPPRPFHTGGKGKPVPAARVLEALSPSPESLYVMKTLEAAIEEAAPLQPKHRAGLRGDIRALWEELTSERESRSADYLGTPPALSAYLRYFLPWNVYRLSAIFSNADFCLPDRAVVADIGSGPLTLPIALYASRPELRDVPLTFYCVDRVERVLEAGQAVFESLCMRVEGRLPPWRIELRKEAFGAQLPERAHLLAAANVFNEFFWKDKRPLGERALETARSLLSNMRENGSLFVMEPGDPRSGAFISALRAAVIAEGASPLGPCPHSLSCPMPGIYRYLLPPEETRVVKGDPNAAPSRFVLPPVAMPKKRDKFPWCHFGVDTEKAPAWLLALSEEAGLPKERAVFSYLWAARGIVARNFAGIPDPVHHTEKERRARAGRGILVRVVSEPFGLPDGTSGQYACSSLGYTLLRRPREEKTFEPGDLLEVTSSPAQRNDEKSGAIILPT